MDENTKAVVASNLTLAYYVSRPAPPPPVSKGAAMLERLTAPTQDAIVTTYSDFLAKISPSQSE